MWPFPKKKIDIKNDQIKSGGNFQSIDKPLSYPNVNPYTDYNYSRAVRDQKFNSLTLLTFYESISQVNSLINFIAQKANEIPIKHYKYLGNGKKKWLGETDVQKSIDKMDIEGMFCQLAIHGNIFLTKKKTPGFVVPDLDLQPSHKMFVIPQYSLDQYGTPNNIKDEYDNPVVGYRKSLDSGHLINFKKEEILHIKDRNPAMSGKDFYYGASRLYAATRSIKVLGNVYDTINTILSAKGALGFISRNSKTGEPDPMMYFDQLEEVERRINKDFGTTGNRNAIMATFADLKWNPMTSPMNDFLPTELTAQEFSQLCNQLGNVPDILFNSKGNSTYNNFREAQKAMYINCVLPVLNLMVQTISKDLGLTINGEWLEPDTDDIDALQVDKKTNAEAKQAEINYLEKMLNKNLVTKNQVLELMNMPTVSDPEFNEYGKPEPIILPAPAPEKPETEVEIDNIEENAREN